MKLKHIYYSLLMFIVSINQMVLGQDLHFSQFYSTPLTLNPANTGTMRKHDFRVSGIRREQWGNLASTFLTTAISGEVVLNSKKLKEDRIGVGIVFYNDNMGQGLLKSQSFLLSSAYHHYLDRRHQHRVSLGAQIGVIQKRIDTDNFRFENQYQNWVFDQNANSGEMITNFSETNLGVHLGGLWEYDISSKLRYTLGMSGFEINNPSENFLNEQKNRLSVRLSLHTGIDYQIAPRLLISPKILLMNQSNARDINLGGMLEYKFAPEFVLLGGAWKRVHDANIAMVGARVFENYEVKFSYDATTSSLRNVQGAYNTPNKGKVAAWEISLILLGNVFNSQPKNYTVPCRIF